MEEEKIGSSISEKVIQQIEARKKIVGKKEGRTNNDLVYLNGKTAWVRLSSGVNTITDEEAEILRDQKGRLDIKGSNQLAGYNILQGGVLNPNRTIRQGIDLSTTTAEDTITDKAAYRNRITTTGIRPMPGITSMGVASKNTFGTLREAEVKISVWTLEDFEMIERIYLRPGFTMLLEWGHTLYVTNTGELITTPPTVGNEFFKEGISRESVMNAIANHRQTSDNNYDGMLGYVKNFSWNYTPAGCYECTVKVISQGEILDSLKMAINPQKRGIGKEEFAPGDDANSKRQRKSVYHFFFAWLEFERNPKFKLSTSPILSRAKSVVSRLQDATCYFQMVESEDHPDAGLFDKKIPHYYLPLRVYLDIFNNFVTLVDNTKSKQSGSYKLAKFNIDYTKSSKFLTIPEHFSIDPSVCALARKDIKLPQGISDWQFGGVACIYDKLEEPENGYDDVLNILVPTCNFEGILDSALDEKGVLTKGATEIIKDLLDTINTALGGINDLDIAYDEELDGGTYFIIDRNNITQKEPPQITIAGIDSIFTDVSISSKISNEVGSNIAIAAQGSSQTFSTNVDNILDWNPNVIDRLIVTKDETETNSEDKEQLEKDEDEKRQEWYQDVINFFNEFNGTGYQDSDVSSAKTLFREYINYWLYYKSSTEGTTSTLPVPVELTIQLDGIGGLKIGQVFKVKSGILPQRYNDDFGYIITGLDHSVENNRWLTNIKTQFYSIKKYKPQGIPAGGVRTGTETDFARQSTKGPTPVPPTELIKAMRRYGITDAKERAHFLAQCAHESGGFRWKKEFASGKAYEGRKDLGNTQPGDGVKFKGRGYIQITGRANYTKYNTYLRSIGSNVDVLANPATLEGDYFAADSACYWWKYLSRNISGLAVGVSPSDVQRVTKRVNGGTNGLADRQAKFDKYWGDIQKNNSAYA